MVSSLEAAGYGLQRPRGARGQRGQQVREGLGSLA